MTDTEKQQTLVFVHIPKTAGTTLNALLASHFAASSTLEIMMRGMSLRLPRRFPMFRPLLSRSKTRRFKKALTVATPPLLIHGHFDMSVGKYLPVDACYVTVLRDPIERAISHYYHYRRQTGDPQHPLAMQSTLKEWVSDCGFAEMDNGQTRRLAGTMDLPIGEVTQQVFDRAKANLAKFFVVGLTERFDEFLALLHRRMHWQYKTYEAQNVGNNRCQADQLDTETLDALKARNQFDLQLYRYATELFEQAVRETGLEPADSIAAAPSLS